MRRALIATLLIVHGLAHSAAGVWAMSVAPVWLVVPLWLIAECGFVGAGLGVAGAPGLRRVWQVIAFAGGIASVALLTALGTGILVIGLAVDVALLVLATAFVERAPNVAITTPPHRWERIAVGAVAWSFVAYLAVVIALRPWYTTWGTSASELQRPLPGDQLVPVAHYRIDHAVTIRAPADSVWPWLAQIGQDRAGFYSYDKLERLVGDRIRNADRVHPEWQDVNVGGLVRAAQPDYLGGVFGRDVGWRIVELQPGRAMVLDRWGAFVVTPVDEQTSRLHVRTRGLGTPTLLGVVLGPANLLAFEPAHFIMQRKMLLGIRDRAEGRVNRRA